MMIENLFLMFIFLFVLVKSADYSIKYSKIVSRKIHLSEFIVSFFIVSIISSLPEGTIAIISALKGLPKFGLGALIGSNVADLLLVFGLAAFFSGEKGVSFKSRMLKRDFFYLSILFFPVLSGLDGNYSVLDGFILVIAGLSFFFSLYLQSKKFKKEMHHLGYWDFIRYIVLLLSSLVTLVLSANYVIKYGTLLANAINIPPILISLTLISIGNCLPELIFSIKAVRGSRDQLALGDILGTVIIDETIYIGISALINPFSFDILTIYVTGFAMFFAGVVSTIFLNTDKKLSKREGKVLLICYAVYLVIEVIINKVIL